MTDPLLCPRIPLNICDITDYCVLGDSATGVDEKLAILDDYICRIDTATIYRPATKEFIRQFDIEQSIGILDDYCHTDSFFRIMAQRFSSFSNIKCLSLPDAYFFLIELKCYINERKTAIIKRSCKDTLLMLGQYRNHFSLNSLTPGQTETMNNDYKFMHPDFYVPESILYLDLENLFTVNDAIQCINHMIQHIQTTHMNDTDLEIYSFFENFRNLMFNKQNDEVSPDVIDRACEYVFFLSHKPSASFKPENCSCRYASFVRTLACAYKNNLSQKR